MGDVAPPNASSHDADKRKSARKRSFLRGKIAYDNGAHSFDCTIRDLSNTGARIDLPAGQIVPKHFVLIDMRNANAYDGELKWRTGSQIGVSFFGAFALDGAVSPENLYLKHLWAGSFRGIDADPASWRSERASDAPEVPVHKVPDQTDVTPEMIIAGVSAYFMWKPAEFRRMYSEPDMVCAVYRAMNRAARSHADNQTEAEPSSPTGE